MNSHTTILPEVITIMNVKTQLDRLRRYIDEGNSWETYYPPHPRTSKTAGENKMFQPDTVAQYQDDPQSVVEEFRQHREENAGPIKKTLISKGEMNEPEIHRHFVQPEGKWGSEEDVHTILDRLDIPTDAHATIIGGYTGAFAKAVRSYGLDVLFTDPNEAWCLKSMKDGFKTQCLRADQLTASHLERTDITMSFEAFQPLQNSGATYTICRNCSVPYGHLIFESEFTRNEMDSDVTLLSNFSWLKNYNGSTCYRQSNGLRAYSFNAGGKQKSTQINAPLIAYWTAMAIAEINRTEESESSIAELTPDLLTEVAQTLDTTPQEVYTALWRCEKINHEKVRGTTIERYSIRENISLACGTLEFVDETNERERPPKWEDAPIRQKV